MTADLVAAVGVSMARVSVRTDGRQPNNRSDNPAISADGRFVAFESAAELTPNDTVSNDIFVRDLAVSP